MTTEVFNREQFEDALPDRFWSSLGLVDNEYCYQINITDDIGIFIRSSVKSNGMAAETGEDSIRAWLFNIKTEKPLGSKTQKWVTRVPGWETRLIEMLRLLWGLAKWAGHCPDCKAPMGVFKVKKDGPNKGKVFKKMYAMQQTF